MRTYLRSCIPVCVLLGLIATGSNARAQGPLLPHELRAAATMAPHIANAARTAVPEVGAAAGIAVIQAFRSAFGGVTARGTATAAIERRVVFASIPRIAGSRFVIVTDRTKFTLTGNVSIPVLYSQGDDVPPHMSQAINQRCASGWAVLEFTGYEAMNEKFTVSCG